MYTTGEIAAQHLPSRSPASTRSTSWCCGRALPTSASTQTIFTILNAEWYYLVAEPVRPVGARRRTTRSSVPGPARARPSPFRGAAPATPSGSRTTPGSPTAGSIGGVLNRHGDGGRRWRRWRWWSHADQDAPEGGAGSGAGAPSPRPVVESGMPPRENPRINTSVDSVYASGPLGRAHCVIHGHSATTSRPACSRPTPRWLARCSSRTAIGSGFASGCQAFGHRELLGRAEARFGLVMEPVLDHGQLTLAMPDWSTTSTRAPALGRFPAPCLVGRR